MNATQPVLGSVLTCPRCGHRKQEVMLPMRASGSTNARAVTWSCGPRQAIAASFAHTARGSARLFKSLDKAAVRRDPRLPRARLRGRRLSFIRRCRDFGFTIEHVRELVGLVDLPSRDCVEVRDIAQAHLREVQKITGITLPVILEHPYPMSNPGLALPPRPTMPVSALRSGGGKRGRTFMQR